MKTVIEMAREAGWKDLRDYDSEMRHDFFMGNTDSLERFAELIRADERNRTWTQEHWTEYERSIAAAEREACAKVCEELLERPSGYQGTWEGYGKFKTQMTGQECSAAIRARSNT